MLDKRGKSCELVILWDKGLIIYENEKSAVSNEIKPIR